MGNASITNTIINFMDILGQFFALLAPAIALYLTIKIIVLIRKDMKDFPFKKGQWINIEMVGGEFQDGIYIGRTQWNDVIVKRSGLKIWINADSIVSVKE